MSITDSSSLSSTLLRVSDILRFKEDYESDMRLLEELPARIKLKKRKYEAALMFAPPGFDPDARPEKSQTPEVTASVAEPPSIVSPTVEPEEQATDEQPSFFLAEPVEGTGRLTWSSGLMEVLDGATSGVGHQDALAKLKKTPLGERVSKGEKGFYNAVANLEKRGKLVKSGGLLYSAKLVEKMKARGELLPNMSSEIRRRAGGAATVALEILKNHPEGLDANALRDELSKQEGMPASVSKHGHYIYNVLATLMGQGAVAKDAAGIYRFSEDNGQQSPKKAKAG